MGACLKTTRWEPKGSAVGCLGELILKSATSDFALWLVEGLEGSEVIIPGQPL